MKCIVMGGSGFVGRWLVKELLDRGDEVLNCDVWEPVLFTGETYLHKDKSDHPKQILESNFMDGIDEVYDLGAVVGTGGFTPNNAMRSLKINAIGTLAVLQAADNAGVKKYYYPAMPDDCENIYTVTKKTGEMICKIFEGESDMEIKLLRWGNIYGPGQALVPRRLVPTVITNLIKGKEVQIFGKGLQKVEVIYVKDVARITVDFMRYGSPGIMHDVDCQSFLSVNELVDIINQLVGLESKIEHLPMRDGEEEDIVDEKPVGENWLKQKTPEMFDNLTSLRAGLLETIKWYGG